MDYPHLPYCGLSHSVVGRARGQLEVMMGDEKLR